MTRIMVVDDHPLIRKQVRQMIQQRDRWEVCGEAADGQEAVEKHSNLNPDVTAMDFNMPLLNGLEAACQILKEQLCACILMMSISDSQQFVEEVRRIGVKGFCSKRDMDAFFDAVEAVSRGETYFTKLSN